MAQFSKYFRLEEFLTSSTARQKSIENMPSWEVVLNLKRLAELLDWLRQDWGSGIKITSGYRCDALNKAVGGVSNSCHKFGYAADLQPSNGKFEEFKNFIVKWVKENKPLFDEIIIERNSKTRWIHIQQYSPNGMQRQKVFSMAV